ncbi:2-succinyl-5-enolpyruvyl-6-hydroxy-3-cyclohexene-1-carboxylic-acid synthase [Nocardia sp. NBC_00881]|uniref:2-succinyl-5-enolpyruvyl-6-hydroxy-3- cyclohexene-1-carboxylic-acid synthase n=1 Tax=Nocardia sp. NBC_00881 TaxID=2975995 RepID=UPI0038665488|nr:2-succinyl-5-enolpyruvyl-6-hydroxy-3-cyclohexene-1-carboxylic-acid synthase [Nocardia sp. NBC_00881]
MHADRVNGTAPSTAQIQAGVIVDELIRCGVREAVLCPGSRNAPLAIALHRADADRRIRLHVRIDERSAAYLALGMAAGSHTVVPVVTTSGTAVANLVPGVLEASYAGVPLMVISANRPGEMQGTGASQTIVQPDIFGLAVRSAMVLAQADHRYPPGGDRLAQHNARWRATVGRLTAAALGLRDSNPGPVHLDVPFAEPLVGPRAWETPPGRRDGGPWTVVEPTIIDAPVEVDLGLDTLVVAGQGAPVLPELAGVPTVAEPSAPPTDCTVHPLVIRQLHPEQVIVVGRPTLHRSVVQLLASPTIRVIVVAPERSWTDVAGTASAVGRSIRATGRPAQAWVDVCRVATCIAFSAVHRALDETDQVTGMHVARAITRQLGVGDTFVVGSSNPVRDVSMTWEHTTGVRVVSNRGVAGIDGLVSMSVGVALAGDRTVALLGDLTFAHDSGGLLVGPSEPVPRDLSIVVANDNGGGIFGLLEQGGPQYADVFERVFGTPHGTDIAMLCAAHGVPHIAAGVADLGEVLGSGAESVGGLRVIEVRTDRDGLRALHADIRSGIERDLFDDSVTAVDDQKGSDGPVRIA